MAHSHGVQVWRRPPASFAAASPASRRTGVIVAAVAVGVGLLYNAWVLGYALDPAAMHGGYLSVLELPRRPHARLFIDCDVITGALALSLSLRIHRLHEPHRLPTGAIVGYALFGIGNVLEAVIPLAGQCAASVAACGIGPSQVLAPHDLASVLSLAGIAVSLLAVRDRGWWAYATLVLWSAAGLFMVASIVTDRWAMLSQGVFLGASGLALAVIPVAALRGAVKAR